MGKKWTKERRQRARELILKNRPWEKSTGPRTVVGKRRSAFNLTKGRIGKKTLVKLDRLLNQHAKMLEAINSALRD